jgi:hypothetical protein
MRAAAGLRLRGVAGVGARHRAGIHLRLRRAGSHFLNPSDRRLHGRAFAHVAQDPPRDFEVALNRIEITEAALHAAHHVELGVLHPCAAATGRDDRRNAAWQIIPILIAVGPLHIKAMHGLRIIAIAMHAEGPIGLLACAQPLIEAGLVGGLGDLIRLDGPGLHATVADVKQREKIFAVDAAALE